MRILHDPDTIQDYLQQHRLMELFRPAELPYLQLHAFDQGEHILHEDEPPRTLYLVMEGDAKVSPASEEGKVALIDYIYAPDLIGEIEYFTREPNYHDVIALTDCRFLAISYDHLDHLFTSNAPFYRYLCERIARKMRAASLKQSRALLYPLKNRLAQYLVDILEYHPDPRIPLSYTQTAEYFGITPRHLRRLLAEMEDAGIVKRHAQTLEVLDGDALRELVKYK